MPILGIDTFVASKALEGEESGHNPIDHIVNALRCGDRAVFFECGYVLGTPQ